LAVTDVENYYRPVINMLKRALKKELPDVMLLNGTYYLPWMISIAAYELKIPIVMRYAGVLSRETFCFPPRQRKIFLAMERSFRKRVYSYVFPSQLCRQAVERDVHKRPVQRAYVIPNPIKVSDNLDSRPAVERRIAAIGRWDKIKNFDVFFQLHKLLLRQKWNHSATFVTGTGRIPGFPKTVQRMAVMRPEGVFQFYRSQGLVVAPSLFETFGNVPIEAACLGVPVLVSDNMGCAEVLRLAGLGNMVMSFSDLKAVAERAKQLCGQQILPRQLNNLRKAVDPKMINEQLLGVLREAARSI